jgi:NAD+ synthase
LYKTQVCELAKFLKVPKEIIEKLPTAGLWSGQTDEAELGFSYEEADPILYLHYEQQKSPKEIVKVLTSSTQRKTKEVEQLVQNVLSHCQKMNFKHVLPYVL